MPTQPPPLPTRAAAFQGSCDSSPYQLSGAGVLTGGFLVPMLEPPCQWARHRSRPVDTHSPLAISRFARLGWAPSLGDRWPGCVLLSLTAMPHSSRPPEVRSEPRSGSSTLCGDWHGGLHTCELESVTVPGTSVSTPTTQTCRLSRHGRQGGCGCRGCQV